jgi:hypothetical protein
MMDAEKYRLVARSLRTTACSPDHLANREHVLSLAAYFDQLACDIEAEQASEIEALFCTARVALHS